MTLKNMLLGCAEVRAMDTQWIQEKLFYLYFYSVKTIRKGTYASKRAIT